MKINSAALQNLASVRQAIGMANLQRAMNQDADSVNTLLKGLKENSKAIQRLAQPHKGGNVDSKA